jgi:serine/threonine protein kinase
MSAAADRNLLFGILALQMDFISRAQLIAAMHAWVLDKRRPLGDILNDHGALEPTRRTLLDALVQEHLQAHGDDPEQSLAAVSSIHSVHTELRQIGDADVQHSLLRTVAQPDSPPPAGEAAGTPTTAGPRYRILRPHAEGGLGAVFVARDCELQRDIALKQLQARHADDFGSRSRFLLEAEITGALEHPGIVPVYGLGSYADGRPFYAMRFIKGANLKEAIDRFHRRSCLPGGTSPSPSPGPARQARPAFDSLEFRQLLGRFVGVCNAVAYAHSRGVLHRDLKPGNVMLGKYGETLVVDWGLAKLIGRAEAPTRSAADGEATVRPSGSGIAETLAGSAVGTPLYMSPEQAAGQLDQLGPASDVYSLGATLFTLLTNRAPVAGKDTLDVLRQVQRGAAGFAGPGASAQGLPPALAAVCRKAMALAPADRYDSPLALAEDLEHWLADEPVRAYREPWPVRTRRWVRRHPGPVSAAAAAVLVAVAGLAVGTALLGEKNQALSDANQSLAAANGQLDAANAELTSSNRQLDAANQELQASNTQLDLARKEAQAAAAKERRATGLALGRLAQIEKANGLLESIFADVNPRLAEKGGPLLSEQLRDRLLDLADKLDEDTIGEPATVARLRHVLANALNNLGESKKAIELHTKVRAAREKLLGPDHPDTLLSMNNLAVAYQDAGQLDLALPLFEETLRLRTARRGPEHPETLLSRYNLARAYRRAGKHDVAQRRFEETLKLLKARLGPDHRTTLECMVALAQGYQFDGKLDVAMPLFEEAHQRCMTTLGADHPDTLHATLDLALAYRAEGKPDVALPLIEDNLKRAKARLGAEHPLTLTFMNALAECYRAARKFQLALPLFEETLKLRQARLGQDHHHTLESMSNLAAAYQEAGKLDLALPLQEETLKLRTAKLGPDHPDTLTGLNNLAVAYWRTGRLDRSVPLFEEALQRLEKKFGRSHPKTLPTVANLGVNYRSAGRMNEALPLLEEVYRASRTLPHLRWVGVDLFDTYSRAGKARAAAALGQEMLAEARKTLPKESTELAGWLSAAGYGLLQVKAFTDAEPLLRECLAIRVKAQPDAWFTFSIKAMLGISLLGQKKHPDAEPLLKEGYEGMKLREKTIPPPGRIYLAQAAEGLVQLCEATDRKEEAKKWTAVLAALDGKLLDTVHDTAQALTLKGELAADVSALIFQVRLKGGVAYEIDLISPNSKALDPYLVLQDGQRQTLAQDDDSGGNRNARIIFRAPADGVYRLRATSFGLGRGSFTLTVRPSR